jgi:bacterial/archaeal transporter family protein
MPAVFAALPAIVAKIGLEGVDSDFATLIRTCVSMITLRGFVRVPGTWSNPFELRAKAWRFLQVSGLATGASWVCYVPALQAGDVPKVAPMDKGSLLLVAVFAVMFLDEPPTMQEGVEILLVGADVLILGFKR